MFELNEAPNKVLAKISAVNTSRNCGTFWSILCCIPTCGGSIPLTRDWNCGCYPEKITLESGAGLKALTDALNKIRVNPSEIMTETDRRSVIEWQVRETIDILHQVANEKVISGDYDEALSQALTQLETRAIQEEKFSAILEKNKRPLTEELYLPKYGMRMEK